jgi:hypothetical protein
LAPVNDDGLNRKINIDKNNFHDNQTSNKNILKEIPLVRIKQSKNQVIFNDRINLITPEPLTLVNKNK